MEKENEEKKPGDSDGSQPPTAEAILATQTADPDQAVIAEQSIRHFITERLSDWYSDVEASIDTLESWIQTQGDDGKAVFAERGFYDYIGDRFISELQEIGGGKGAPVMDAISSETDNTVSWAQHAESDLGQFINYMRRGVRDACWYVRDAAPSVLSNQWPQLLDLAYEGSVDFIPALYAMGLPTLAFKPTDLSDKLTAHADAYRKAIAPVKEEATDKVAQSDDKKVEVQEETQKLAQDDSLKKDVQAATL